MLTPPLQELQKSVRGALGKELLAELCVSRWEHAVFQEIEPLRAAYGFSTGSKRPRNEDRVAIAHIAALNQVRYTVAILCDGVGGSERGDVAATVAIATVLGGMAEARGRVPLELLLRNLVHSADDSVRSALMGRGATTLSVLAVSSAGEFAAANVGDSRIFAWTPGGRSFKQISIDDTFENELRGLHVKDPSALAAHGLRGRLTQAIGEGGRQSIDLQVNLLSRENFPAGAILASDGAWKADALAFELINAEAKTATDAVRRALAFAGWAGGLDNTSVLAIEDLETLSSYEAQREGEWRAPSSIRMTSWIGGRSLVMSHSFAAQASPQLFPEVNRPEPPPPKDKPKRKGSAKRKTVVQQVGHDEPELDLNVDRPSGKVSVERPQVEISTDEDATNKS